MKFYKAFCDDPQYYIASPVPLPAYVSTGREVHPRDLPETGILGTAYDAGLSDGLETAQTGWKVAREQLIAERDALCDDNKSLTIQRDALATSRDNAVSASQHIAKELEKEKQYHLAAIMQRNSYRTELSAEVERANHIASECDSLEKERDRLQETVDELQEQNTDLLRCVDTAQERDRQLNESLDRVVADRDRFQKLLGESQQKLYKSVNGDFHHDLVKKLREQLNKAVAERANLEKQLRAELATVYSGGKAYAEGLANGKGYAYTEISNHCRELRAKLPGEY